MFTQPPAVEGDVAAASSIARDITELKQTDAALATARDQATWPRSSKR